MGSQGVPVEMFCGDVLALHVVFPLGLLVLYRRAYHTILYLFYGFKKFVSAFLERG